MEVLGRQGTGSELPIGGDLVEQDEARVVAGQQARRPPRHLRADIGPLVESGHRFGQQLGPQVGVRVHLEQGEGHRSADGRREPAHPVHLLLRVGDVLAGDAGRRQLEDPGPELAQGPADPEQLVLGGEGPGHGFAVDGPVGDGARGRHTEGPGGHRLRARSLAMAAMSRAVAGSLRAPRSPHDVGPDRAVGHLGADVDRPAAPVQGVEILGKGLPLPLDAPR